MTGFERHEWTQIRLTRFRRVGAWRTSADLDGGLDVRRSNVLKFSANIAASFCACASY